MDTLITIKDLGQMLGLCRSSVYSLVKSEGFPKPYSLTARSLRWEKLEVEAWLESGCVAFVISTVEVRPAKLKPSIQRDVRDVRAAPVHKALN
jgi:predicted DNA-binding transcriptional regulator AlpA